MGGDAPPAGRGKRLPGRLLGLIALLALPLCAGAQKPPLNFHFQPLTSEHGLAQNAVDALLQDRAGLLWIGTTAGVQKYDGYRFQTLQGVANLADGSINALVEDAAGNIWIATRGAGLGRYTPASNLFERANLRGGESAADCIVQALEFDPQHGIWVACREEVILIDPRNLNTARKLGRAQLGGASAQIYQLRLAGDGTLWIASSEGLWRLDPDANHLARIGGDSIRDAHVLLRDRSEQLWVAADRRVHQISLAGDELRVWPEGSLAGRISALAEDQAGRIWISASGQGLGMLEPATGTVHWVDATTDTASGLPPPQITQLLVDRSGLLWAGTAERGLLRVDPAGTPFRHLQPAGASPENRDGAFVQALLADDAGGFWIGVGGSNLGRYDATSGTFRSYDGVSVDPSATGTMPVIAPHVIAAATGGRDLWLATSAGAGRFDPLQRRLSLLPMQQGEQGPGLSDRNVHCILSARDGSLWLGTALAGLNRYQPQTGEWTHYRVKASADNRGGMPADMVLALAEAPDGGIWAGTTAGLAHIDPRGTRIEVYRSDPDDPHALPADGIRALHVDPRDRLWVGTLGGLARLDSITQGRASFTRWLPADGLRVGTISTLVSDTGGRIWMSGSRGLGVFDERSGEFRDFTAADGLHSGDFTGGAAALLKNGDLVFGGSNGLTLFTPREVLDLGRPAPVMFTAARLGERTLPAPTPGGELRMNESERVAQFRFAALDYAAPERNQFSYRLVGLDSSWSPASNAHEATYSNLSAGRYLFEVKASNHLGAWGPEAGTIALIVASPWWASWPARLTWLLAGVGLTALGWRLWRQRRIEDIAHLQALRQRDERLRMALWGSGDDFWDWNLRKHQTVIIGTRELAADSTIVPGVLSQEDFLQRVHPDDRQRLAELTERHLRGETKTLEPEFRLRNSRGEWGWIMLRGRIVEYDDAQRPLRVSGTARNVTASRAAEQERRIAHEVLRSMAEAVVLVDCTYHVQMINAAFTRITGWTLPEIVGKPATVLNGTRHPEERYIMLRDALARDGRWSGELWQKRRDGDEFLSWCEVTEVRDSDGKRTHFVAVLSDITHRKQAEQELRYLANYDVLTGLPNRTLLGEQIAQAIAQAQRRGQKVAILFLDLDRFKHVNDSLGHAMGDRMLKAVGNRLRLVVREGDSVARLGGDEFTVMLENIGDAGAAAQVAEKIINAFDQPLELENGQEIAISPSIGISLFPDHGSSADELLKRADTAMYQAKDQGRRTWMIYTSAMETVARLRATTITALRKAMARSELSLVYQPRMSLVDDRVTGVEALLRWRSAELGDVAPGVFIPIAEEAGLIVDIGNWVVSQACAQLAAWRDAGLNDLMMSINVSVAQLLRGNLIQHLSETLAEHDIAPSQIELELTESVIMANAAQSVSILRKLKAIGVSLAIDDFGTGYSSLSYLKRLPMDTLKIDKEFVGDITTDPDDEAITATVIAMAHSLDLNVIAEGVETAEQIEYLRRQGCDEVQGHWLSFPLPAARCQAFLRESAATRASPVEPSTMAQAMLSRDRATNDRGRG